MAGLLDSMLGDPNSQGLYALASGLLGVRRGGEGRAFMGALNAYNQAQQEQRRNQLVELQKQFQQMQIDQHKRQMADEDKYRAVFSDPSKFIRSKQSAFPA